MYYESTKPRSILTFLGWKTSERFDVPVEINVVRPVIRYWPISAATVLRSACLRAFSAAKSEASEGYIKNEWKQNAKRRLGRIRFAFLKSGLVDDLGRIIAEEEHEDLENHPMEGGFFFLQ